MRTVRNKSIPNVDDDRLVDSIAQLHAIFHTVEGLRKFDGPRRGLYDHGVKILLIKAELDRRGVPSGIEGCVWCSTVDVSTSVR